MPGSERAKLEHGDLCSVSKSGNITDANVTLRWATRNGEAKLPQRKGRQQTCAGLSPGLRVKVWGKSMAILFCTFKEVIRNLSSEYRISIESIIVFGQNWIFCKNKISFGDSNRCSLARESQLNSIKVPNHPLNLKSSTHTYIWVINRSKSLFKFFGKVL